MKQRTVLLTLGFAVVAILGYLLARITMPPSTDRTSQPRTSQMIRGGWMYMDTPQKSMDQKRQPTPPMDVDAALAGALQNQRVIVFKDQDALARFLKNAGDRIQILGRIDALHALRVGFPNNQDLLAQLSEDDQQSFIFPVSVPTLPQGSVQPGAIPIGSHLLDWLGVTVDHSSWGTGIQIAIIDTGVTASSAFTAKIKQVNLVPLPTDPTQQNSHGTEVASMIIGNNAATPGVAPATSILSIRAANDNGQSDTFLIAQGIMTAVDAGVQAINISMGGFGDSAVLQNAVQYAADHGVLIFAAAGNNGIAQVAYPAAYSGVIAVGAADRKDNHLDFSNTGKQIAISGPGLGINAAATGDQAFSVTGTSFASPAVLGAAIGVASAQNISLPTAWHLLVQFANDTGAAGQDTATGAGTPAIDRVLNANTRGIYDAAIASQTILPPDAGHPYGQVEILVQNRGTEPLINTTVQFSNGSSQNSANITNLAPNGVHAVLVTIPKPPTSSSFTVSSRVVLSNGLTDAKPSNDSRVITYAPNVSP
jgi:hypothetical protein